MASVKTFSGIEVFSLKNVERFPRGTNAEPPNDHAADSVAYLMHAIKNKALDLEPLRPQFVLSPGALENLNMTFGRTLLEKVIPELRAMDRAQMLGRMFRMPQYGSPHFNQFSPIREEPSPLEKSNALLDRYAEGMPEIYIKCDNQFGNNLDMALLWWSAYKGET